MIIGITGKIGSGKSTLADYLVEKYNYTEYSFASPLKKIGEIFGFSQRQLYGSQEDKLEKHEIWGVSARDFLQKVGTELFRENLQKVLPDINIHRGIWCDIFRDEYRKNPGLYVVSDVRFLDEYQTIQDLGGIVIRVDRGSVDRGGKEHAHRSELEMEYIVPDYIIENDKGVEELKGKMDDILTERFLDYV
jgi:dephospho-CoA kinase